MSLDDKALLVFLKRSAKCCLCEGSMARTTHLNMVSLDKKASWEFPVWGNILVENSGDRAVALICDPCVEAKMKPGVKIQIKYAVELSTKKAPAPGGFMRVLYDGIIYHRAEELEDAFPITEEMVREAERKKFGTRFVAS